MNADLYLNLAWLPRAPEDFSTRCRSLLEPGPSLGSTAQALASHSLDQNQMHRLAKAIGKSREAGHSLAPLTPFRLGVLSNSTVDFIVPALVATAARYGIALECIAANYDQAIQDALSPDSIINKAKLEAVLLALDFRGLPVRATPGDSRAADSTIQRGLSHLETIRSGIKGNSNAFCIVQTLAAPPESLFGSLDRMLPGTLRSVTDGLNRGIAAAVAGSEDLLLDVAGIAETVGLAEWHCPRQWNMGKFPFSDSCLPLYADHVLRVIAGVCGKSRRCLILDLDNTLWGGVIGDDGLEGISVAQGDATGEAYLNIQRSAIALRERGVVLAVSSKNEDETARLPFRRHPEMLLRENHFAVFQANWNDKATNIKAIAEELSLGLDSMVFLDDNPVERGLVRHALPQVAVPELPDDPALYARTLAAAGYFESVRFLQEDLNRANFYQDNARRIALQKQANDLDAYLESLDMEITFQPFDETGRARITQLINKSNQFNLTTRRYTEAEVAQIACDPLCFTLQVRLSDAFGDNGMISVIVCRSAANHRWEIDTWLMSCRVLGRRVEEVVLQELLLNATDRGIRTLAGTYIPTPRNKLVEGHYQKLGFAQVGAGEDGQTTWELPTEKAAVQALPLRVRRIGYEMTEIQTELAR